MDRQSHDYAAAIAFAQQHQQQSQQHQQQANIQQVQQFGFHPQPQQFSQPLHAPPFLPHHPSLQYPFHRQQQQQPLPLPHHLPPTHHLLHLQQQAQQPFPPPHMPPHIHPSPYFDPTPSPSPPPTDPELHKRIDKLVEYSAKNGPEFEAMIREKQQDNPAYSFLFGGDGHSYYRYKLWLTTRTPTFPSPLNPSPFTHQPNPLLGPTQLHHSSPFPPFYDHQQQQHQIQQQQPFLGQLGREFEPLAKFKGLSGPLPTDVAAELSNVLNNLSGTKESIKGAKLWFMQRSPFAPALAEALRERVFALDDSERQLHIIYLANDILFESLQRRVITRELDNEALAFKPVLGSMLARIYHNPHNKDANQSRLQKILQFWASKEVYDPDTIYALEGDMIAGPPSGLTKEPSSAASVDSTGITGLAQGPAQSVLQWQPDQQRNSMPPLAGQDQQEIQGPPTTTPSASQFTATMSQHFLSNSSLTPAAFPSVAAAPPPTFTGSLPMPTPPVQQPGINQPAMPNPLLVTSATLNTNVGGEQAAPPPYPLFPPGLIPGMVRKMQIGSGVPYSPMSPLDIPTVIPPSTVSPAYILERVSKFFKEIGEVNPSEGPLKGVVGSNTNDEDDDEYEQDSPIRKGGACIPPPPNLLQVDPETGTLPDGSVERKPGSGGGSGRLGLGATANPNEVSQYDDVYTSYRKHRSTSYHSSMSARAAAR